MDYTDNSHLFRNRMKLCYLAVCLMWMTSLKVSVYLTSKFIHVPEFQKNILQFCNATFQIVEEEKENYSNCIESNLDRCNDYFQLLEFLESDRVNRTEVSNAQVIDYAENLHNRCTKSYNTLSDSFKIWAKDGSSVSFHNDATTCSQEDINHISTMVGDLSAAKSQALDLSLSYSSQSLSTVETLATYLKARKTYDIEYISNHTQLLRSGFNTTFGILRGHIDGLVSCISPRSDTQGVCSFEFEPGFDVPNFDPPGFNPPGFNPPGFAVPFLDTRIRLQGIMDEVDLRLQTYEHQLHNIRIKTKNYAEDVMRAYNNMRKFYEGARDIIKGANIFNIKLGSWWNLGIDTDMKPINIDFDFPSPHFGELPSLDNVWDSTSFPYASLNAKLENLKISLENEFNLLESYDPPKYVGTSPDISSSEEEMSKYKRVDSMFRENADVVLDGFSNMLQFNENETEFTIPRINFTGSVASMSNFSYSFENLQEPTVDYNTLFFQLSSLSQILYSIDFLIRLYSTLRLIYKYWDSSSVDLPSVDLRTTTKLKLNPLKTNPMKLFLNILMSKAVLFMSFCGTFAWIVITLSAVYAPLFAEYHSGCVSPELKGTFLTSNIYSMAYNYAMRDASKDAISGLDAYDAMKIEACSQSRFDSEKKFEDNFLQLNLLISLNNSTKDKVDLIEKCVDLTQMDSRFEQACCSSRGSGYNSCAFYYWSRNETDQCPLQYTLESNAPYLPPTDYLSNCTTFLNDDNYVSLADSVFNCDVLPTCNLNCEGPQKDLIKRSSSECGCVVEWYFHSVWLRIILSTFVYLVMNFSRVLFIQGLARVLWRKLTNCEFTFHSSCRRNGSLIFKGGDHSTNLKHAIDKEFKRIVPRFEAIGYFMIILAILSNVSWIYLLSSTSYTVTPFWFQ